MELDASHGEGGGQVVRTAVALAAVTGTELVLEHVRADRDSPGLKRQHLACVETLAATCDASLDGAEVGSRRLRFAPDGPVAGGLYEVDIGTAGSVTLLAQAVLPAAFHADGRVELAARGGTDVAWSPTADYLRHVTLPLLARAGVDASFKVHRRGHYPEGGGEVTLTVTPGPLEPLRIEESGGLWEIRGISEVANLDRGIAERQRDAAREALLEAGVEAPIAIEIEEAEDAYSTGTSITLWAEHDEATAGGDGPRAPGTVLGGSALGEPGKPAEEVGREAAGRLHDALQAPGTVDRHTADQLVPYVALGGGRYVAPEATSHLETNAWVCRRFGLDVAVESRDGDAAGVAVSGSGAGPGIGTGTD